MFEKRQKRNYKAQAGRPGVNPEADLRKIGSEARALPH